MAYVVSITTLAERDLDSFYAEINAEYSDAARKWYKGFRHAILSLEERPNRCPVTRKRANLRQLLYGHKPHIYLVIYRLRERPKQVEVLHIRHGARRQPHIPDLD
jgi:plasmid stabilization system protein ParE